jgi:Bacterial Ig-like domain
MRNVWNKRIPTLFAFAMLLIGVVATAYLTQIGVIPFGNAAPEEIPKDIRITNITDTSFTVTYHTDIPILGSVAVGTDSVVGQVALDDRDQATGRPQSYKLHSITIRNLKPVTKYYYIITSGKTIYGTKDNPLSVTTGSVLTTSPSAQTPLAGEIQVPGGETVAEAIVYASTQDGQILSTLVKPTGLYILPLNNMRTTSLTSYATFSDTTVIQIIATDGTNQSQASILAGKSNPVPPMTLTNNYDFTLDVNPITPSQPPVQVGFSALSVNTPTSEEKPNIQRPTKNEKFTDHQPLFSGQALPNQPVQITIHSQENIQKTVTADANGNWSFRPSQPLSPGDHAITIVTKDATGILKTIQQVFTIFPSGTQVAEAATPSATPIVTPTTAPTAIPTPTIATPTPTTVLTPTMTLSPSPIASVSMTPAPTQKPIPATGSNALVQIGSITLVTTTIGIVLFVLGSGIAL